LEEGVQSTSLITSQIAQVKERRAAELEIIRRVGRLEALRRELSHELHDAGVKNELRKAPRGPEGGLVRVDNGDDAAQVGQVQRQGLMRARAAAAAALAPPPPPAAAASCSAAAVAAARLRDVIITSQPRRA
jgi:hypothetical protein